MQRVKALMTGTLPVFVEAGGNFLRSALREDTLLTQARARGLRTVFAGDDTWVDLFPGAFARAAPFPSFNVFDLHTVDSGVRKHLLAELGNSNNDSNSNSNSTSLHPDSWDLLIGHTLGVDHCGHRYGPEHPAMAAKLEETDALIADIIERLPPDTALFVFGDHGMTSTGDHGGASRAEVDAALFVHIPAPRASLHPGRHPAGSARIQQIDLAATLSLLLDIPIPFSSLGQARPELLGITSITARLAVARANAAQVCASAGHHRPLVSHKYTPPLTLLLPSLPRCKDI